jgi:glycerate dehydrogenase
MKIINLDGDQLNPGDLSWQEIEDLGSLTTYASTPESLIVERAIGAEIVITNKVPFTRETIEALPDLKCICVSATGFNIIDIEAAKDHQIVVCNAPGYSKESVAQHVFASILTVYNRIENYARESREGKWSDVNDWSYTNEPVSNMEGKTLGIIGFGQIGQRVGELALAFKMKVIAFHKHPKRDAMPGVDFVDIDTLFQSSDVISLHVPLNESTHELVDKTKLALMKSSAILINTGRGPLVNEADLADALQKRKLRAAVLDVMVNEPPSKSNPLLNIENCYITPHVAWAGVNARKKLMHILADNIQNFKKGTPINRVN